MNPGKPPEIPLVVVGCDFRIAAVLHRGALVTTPEERARIFEGVSRLEQGCGFAALETCNRIEWIMSTTSPEWMSQLLLAQMQQRWQAALPAATDFPKPYVYYGREAARHLLRVAAGFESLAAGEAQIAGQLQDALRRARDEKTSSSILNGLATNAGRLAKEGFHIGFRSDHRRGIHGMASEFLKQHFAGVPADKTVIVAGMGSIGRKVAEVVESQLGCRVIRVNRTIQPQHESAWQSLAGLPDLVPRADALIVATGSLEPVITAEALHSNVRGAPLLVLDIGIPRQVSEDAGVLGHIEYRNLDDLIELKPQHDELELAERMEQEIEEEVRRFKRFCIERNIVSLLEDTQRRRETFIHELIPAIVESEFSELDERTQKQVEGRMKQLIREYSSNSFDSIHDALDNYWSSM